MHEQMRVPASRVAVLLESAAITAIDHRMCLASQVAWNAYLSTLSHAPVLDTEGLLGVIDQAQSLLDSFLPVEIQVWAGL